MTESTNTIGLVERLRERSYEIGNVNSPDLSKTAALLEEAADALEAALRVIQPFAEPHFMGDHYVKFAPRLILAARRFTQGDYR